MPLGAQDPYGRYAWGLMGFGGKTVYYELVDEWKPQQRPGPAGGVLTMQIRTGARTWQARELWAEQPLEVTPALQAAIEVDQQRHARKRQV